MKRGQVAIFIIIAIIIVFSIISYFIILDLSNKKSGEESKYLSESLDVSAKDIENQILDFIEENVYSCVKKISKQGGYLTIPVEVYVKQTSYWYYEGKNLKPTLKFIEGEINNCILNQLKNSTNQLFGRYGNKTISIDIQGIKSSTRITEQGIFTEVDYPIYIYKETSSLKINSFKFTYQTNFNKLYNFAAEIVNFAATPEFDKCNPFKEFSDEEINFSFFTEGDNLFIKGQIFLITQDKTKIPYELIFAIKRPIKEAFGENKKRLAVLYQEDKDWPTFGDKAIQILKNDLEIQEGADYFDCKQVGDFISRIEDYDVVIITGNLQFQIAKKTFLLGGSKEEVSFSDSGDSEGWTLIYGCDAFNRGARKITIKNWVNQGGFLWINDIAEYETDDFFRSYIGSLGYHGGELKLLGTDLRKSSLQESLLGRITERRTLINLKEKLQKEHKILTCPHDISNEITGTWTHSSLQVTEKDNVIIGTQQSAKLWTRELGKGLIVFDEFLLKDNLLNNLNYEDDLYSKGLAEKYFVNVMNYLSKFKKPNQSEQRIFLIKPKGNKIQEPLFSFSSDSGINTEYSLLITNTQGETIFIKPNKQEIKESLFDRNKLIINLTENFQWQSLNDTRYEWQIFTETNGEKYYSEIEYFLK